MISIYSFLNCNLFKNIKLQSPHLLFKHNVYPITFPHHLLIVSMKYLRIKTCDLYAFINCNLCENINIHAFDNAFYVSTFTISHKSYSRGYLSVILIPAALLERTKKVEKYIDYLMSEVREMREGNGFICLKVLQLWFFVLPLVSKNQFLKKNVAYLWKPYVATWMRDNTSIRS